MKVAKRYLQDYATGKSDTQWRVQFENVRGWHVVHSDGFSHWATVGGDRVPVEVAAPTNDEVREMASVGAGGMVPVLGVGNAC